MRGLGLAALGALALAGCASTKVVQRDGCWVRRIEKPFGRVHEEVGPCMRKQPEWADDRLTRLVQECVAQADYRWQVAALDAWNKGQPLPAQEPQEKLLDACMSKGAAGMIAENENLKSRLDEVTTDRDALRVEDQGAQAKLRQQEEKLIGYLGEAAKKPAGTAYANASSTSDGKASNESGASLRSDAGSSAEPVLRASEPGARRVDGAPAPPVAAPVPVPEQPAAPTDAPRAATAEQPVPAAQPAPRRRKARVAPKPKPAAAPSPCALPEGGACTGDGR